MAQVKLSNWKNWFSIDEISGVGDERQVQLIKSKEYAQQVSGA